MNCIEKKEQWYNHPDIDPSLKDELAKMSDKDAENAFFKDIEFGTAGMRGIMGAGTDRINIHTIRKATQGFANYLKKNHLDKVAIAYDNRFHSKEFAYDCAALLSCNGIRSFLFDDLRPTPELSFAVRYYQCDGGIMITASHNSKEYNGYKLYDETGCQLIPEIADKVIREVNAIEDPLSISINHSDSSLITIVNKECDEAYYEKVLSISLRKGLKSPKIVFSPEHGASFVPVMETLKRAGYDVVCVKEQSFPDGAFPNTKSPNPELKEAYEGVIALGKKENADLLLVCDPDGDRMGVGVKKDDDYFIFNGNQTGALLLEYILSTQEELGIVYNRPCIFNTIVTSDIGEAVAAYYGVECEKTLTGFKYIGSKIRKYESNGEKDYVFGYEESYGSLICPFVRDKDATQACLMLAEAAAYYLEAGKSLYDVLNDIFSKVGAFYDEQFSIVLPGAEGAKKLQEIMSDIRKSPLKIYDTSKIEDYLFRKTYYSDGSVADLSGFDKTDALKYYFTDGSFVAIRPSGTEPKCKFYLSMKADTYDEAICKANDVKTKLKDLLNDR